MSIAGLMACDPRGLIGKVGGLPWNCPEDTEHFRNLIVGETIIMGRATYLSLPQKILDRSFSIVFSRKKLTKMGNVAYVSSLDEFQNLRLDKKSYMIGGGEIAGLFLDNNLLDEFILTKIKKEYEGDKFITLDFFEGKPFDIISDNKDFSILRYNLKNG